MFANNMYSGPGRKNKLTGGLLFFIIILLVLQCSIIVLALNLAGRTKAQAVWLDPYLQISIRGAPEQLISRAIAPLETAYTVTSIEE